MRPGVAKFNGKVGKWGKGGWGKRPREQMKKDDPSAKLVWE